MLDPRRWTLDAVCNCHKKAQNSQKKHSTPMLVSRLYSSRYQLIATRHHLVTPELRSA
jgi:hypothetical protein